MDGDDNLVGFLTVRTILKSLDVLAFKDTPLSSSGTDIILLGTWSGFFLKSRLESISKVKVKEVMRPVFKVFVNETNTLQEVAKAILKTQVNHIPVLDKNQKAVGIIRTVDILDILGSFLDE